MHSQSIVARSAQQVSEWCVSARPVDWPLKIVDSGILAVLFVAPLFFGGRHDVGLFVYSVIVTTIAAAWLVHRSVKQPTSASFCPYARMLLVASPALLLLQLLPLPSAALRFVSPEVTERLIAWGASEGSLGEWRTVTVDAWSTRASLATLLTHVVLFSVVAERLRTVGDATWIVTRLAAASVFMSALAVVQYATGTKDLLWCCPLAFRDPSLAAIGSFTSPNHCGHFIALGAGAMLVTVVRSSRNLQPCGVTRRGTGRRAAVRKERIVFSALLSGLLIMVLAVLLTFSRGALIALAASLSVTALLLFKAGWVGRSHLLKAALGLVGVGIMLSLTGYADTSHRLGGVSINNLDQLSDTTDRQTIWRANLAAFASNPVMGFGAGTHRQVYQLFTTKPSAATYTHAESGYLQVATEAGLLGCLALLLAIALVGGWCARGIVGSRSAEELALWAAIAAGLTTSLLHSVADFVWFIPSCVAPVVLLSAAAMRLHRLRTATGVPVCARSWGLPALTNLACAGACLVLLVGPARSAVERDHYDQTSVALRRYSNSLFAKTRSAGSDRDPQVLASREYYADRMIEQLSNSAAADPTNPLTQLRLARQCLHRFELAQVNDGNGFGVDAVRGAVENAKFESRQAMVAWLRRAFGESSQLLLASELAAQRAVQLCPLQGEAYLYLAQLAFLSDTPRRGEPLIDTDLLVEQALLLRPNEGAVLFEAGKHFLVAGEQDRALALWKQSGQKPGAHLVKLASVASALFPASDFIRLFEPDWQLTYAAYEFYRQSGTEPELLALANHATLMAERSELTEAPRHAAHHWWQAATIHRQLGDLDRSVECSAQALRLDPSRLHVRRGMAHSLYLAKRYDEADPHIRWCLARRPDDAVLRKWLQQIAKQRINEPQAAGEARVAGKNPRRWEGEYRLPQPERYQ